MHHSFRFQCNTCGDEIDLCTNSTDGGRCRSCSDGQYHQCGESYDQEWVDEQKYNEQQDREYEERHRHDYH